MSTTNDVNCPVEGRSATKEKCKDILLQRPIVVVSAIEDDFLSRVNLNDKINNILRSPSLSTSTNNARQRSVFTSNSSQRFFTGCATQSLTGLTTLEQHPLVSVANNLHIQTSGTKMAGVPYTIGRGGVSIAAKGGSDADGSDVGVPLGAPEFTSSPEAWAEASSDGKFRIAQSRGNVTVFSPTEPTVPDLPTQRMQMGPILTQDPILYETPPASRTATLPRGVFGTRYPTPPSSVYTYDTQASMPAINQSQQFAVPMPPPPHNLSRMASNTDYDNFSPQASPGAGLIVMTNGTIQMRLRDGIRIDMTLDRAVRVVNQRCMVAIALSWNGSCSALVHPNGRVLQSGSKVEIVTYDAMRNNKFVRYAKMWYKGVSFTSDSCALIYLVDSAGTRTTSDSFTDMTKDYTLTVFYDESRHGPTYVQDAAEVVQNSTYVCTEEGMEIYEINGFRIMQTPDGLVKLTRDHNKCLIRTSPSNGSATITTPSIHCTASLGRTSHLFVRRNEKRMHFDGSCFIVRNAGHSAGFNEDNLLIVY